MTTIEHYMDHNYAIFAGRDFNELYGDTVYSDNVWDLLETSTTNPEHLFYHDALTFGFEDQEPWTAFFTIVDSISDLPHGDIYSGAIKTPNRVLMLQDDISSGGAHFYLDSEETRVTFVIDGNFEVYMHIENLVTIEISDEN